MREKKDKKFVLMACIPEGPACMERGKRRVSCGFHIHQCEKHFPGYLNLPIHNQQTNKLLRERVTTWKSALVTVC